MLNLATQDSPQCLATAEVDTGEGHVRLGFSLVNRCTLCRCQCLEARPTPSRSLPRCTILNYYSSSVLQQFFSKISCLFKPKTK